MTATTQDQSKRLLACGIDPSTADMSIRTIKEPYICENLMWYTPELKTLPYSEAKYIYGCDEIDPAWTLTTLLSMLPQVIYAPDITDVPDDVSLEDEMSGNFVPPIKEFQWRMWRTQGSRFELNGEEKVIQPIYGIAYEGIRFMPPTHPIAPNSPTTLYLYDDDGNRFVWSDEDPIEACVKAIEWLTGNGFKLNEIEQ